MIGLHKRRLFSLPRNAIQKTRILYAAKVIRRGGLIAHQTSTVAGVATTHGKSSSISQLARFKQRAGPFLLLADSRHTALSLARYLTPELRRLSKAKWPGTTTFIYPARRIFPPNCHKRGSIAVRVDADRACRQLAKACGGFLLSSSLNRKGGDIQEPTLAFQMRWHRHLAGRLFSRRAGSGQASALLRVTRSGVQKLR
ncbi:MAG: Sua5/YciO/YrdC/YwlC family protein [Mariprofundaceae bacterium]